MLWVVQCVILWCSGKYWKDKQELLLIKAQTDLWWWDVKVQHIYNYIVQRTFQGKRSICDSGNHLMDSP